MKVCDKAEHIHVNFKSNQGVAMDRFPGSPTQHDALALIAHGLFAETFQPSRIIKSPSDEESLPFDAKQVLEGLQRIAGASGDLQLTAGEFFVLVYAITKQIEWHELDPGQAIDQLTRLHTEAYEQRAERLAQSQRGRPMDGPPNGSSEPGQSQTGPPWSSANMN